MAEEEKGTLNTLIESVQTYKTGSQAGKGGWIAGGIALVIAVIVIGISAWQQWKAGKERATLLHEQAVREEEAHQAVIDAALEEEVLAKEAAMQRADELQAAAFSLMREIDALEMRRERARATIDQIASWEDIDEIVR